MTAADAIYNAEQANYGPANQVDTSGFDMNSETTNPRMSLDFNGTAAATANVGADWILYYTENSALNALYPSSSARSSARAKFDINHTELTDFDTTKVDDVGVHYEFHKQSKGRKSVSGTGDTDIVYTSKKGTYHFSNFTSSFLHGNFKADVYDLGKKHSGNSIYSFNGNDKVNASSSQTVNLGSGNDVYTIEANSRRNSLLQILTGEGNDKVIIKSAKARFTIADFDPFLDTGKVGKELDGVLFAAKLIPFEKGKKILDNVSIKFFYNGSPVGTAYLSSDPEFIRDLIDPITHQNIYALNSTRYDREPIERGYSA